MRGGIQRGPRPHQAAGKPRWRDVHNVVEHLPAGRRAAGYYRVSTQKQGRSGLGLEAQQKAVRDHLNGGNWKVVGEFIEIESGRRSDRPQLAAALAACRLHGAKLIIAKLDRLARNVHFISGLMESKVDFVAVDFPQANRLTARP
jgi:DNA invertase Pin-like site-specific DNA recombinase